MSNQISIEEMQRRGALLKKAKQILIQEYAAIRTQQHQQWIRDSETSWKMNGILMAYPPGKLYPGEQEIVDKALELYNKSIPSVINVDVPIVNSPEPLGSSPVDVTAKLQEVYSRAPSLPVDNRLIGVTVSDYIETLNAPISEPINTIPESTVEPVVEEPVVEDSTTTDSLPKHSLLRSVLSGWLSKNKDKEI
jgi:hypothetical protein